MNLPGRGFESHSVDVAVHAGEITPSQNDQILSPETGGHVFEFHCTDADDMVGGNTNLPNDQTLPFLAFARGDVVFIFSFKIFYFLYRTGRYWIYFTVTICILSYNCKQIDY